eukprot:scaffold258382_cov30-Prasinocladus_malaysianus.AAC.1
MESQDPFYDSLQVSFEVNVLPEFVAASVAAPLPIPAPDVPFEVDLTDDFGVVFQPGSLPEGTTVLVDNLHPNNLTCSMELTRFVPFGYQSIEFDPPLPGSVLDPPARIYWRVPFRYRTLHQLKFMTTPSANSCDWTLKVNISLEERYDPMANETEYWAFVDVSHFSVYALARVLPLLGNEAPSFV